MGSEAWKYIRSDHNPDERNSARKVEDLVWRFSIPEMPRRRITQVQREFKGCGEELSEEMKPCGVPQRSCLGPLLFTIYASKIFEIIKEYLPQTHAYADDTQL